MTTTLPILNSWEFIAFGVEKGFHPDALKAYLELYAQEEPSFGDFVKTFKGKYKSFDSYMSEVREFDIVPKRYSDAKIGSQTRVANCFYFFIDSSHE